MAKHGRSPDYPSYPYSEFTNKRPLRVRVLGSEFAVSSWRDVLLKTAEAVHMRNPSKFDKVLQLKGSKRPWFSLNPSELRFPARVGGSKYFVELNLSANNTVRVCRHLLAKFDYEPKIHVILK